MWPFKKPKDAIPTIPADQISFTQLDVTESFGDDGRLVADEWIDTVPLNESTPDAQAMGLPAIGASDHEVYETASRLSEIRESISVPNDGVYCPICHIASTQLTRLRTPCPQCGRPLLEFGWD